MAKKNPYKPPRFGEGILLFLLPKEYVQEVLGDLRFEYGDKVSKYGERRARFWYWRQVLPVDSYLMLLILKLRVTVKSSHRDHSLSPTKFSVAILKLILPAAKADNVLGDLDETYQERVTAYGLNASIKWYRKQVRASIWEFILEGIKDQFFSWIGRRVR